MGINDARHVVRGHQKHCRATTWGIPGSYADLVNCKLSQPISSDDALGQRRQRGLPPGFTRGPLDHAAATEPDRRASWTSARLAGLMRGARRGRIPCVTTAGTAAIRLYSRPRSPSSERGSAQGVGDPF